MIRAISLSTILLGLALGFGCDITDPKDSSKKTMNGEPRFTYQVEMAGYEFGQSDKKGQIDLAAFTKNFEDFPWIDQIEKAKKIGKVSPTLTVDDNEKNQALWVSAMGDSNQHVFLIGHVYPKEMKGLFGLGKPRQRKWIEIYLTEDKEVMKECYQLFFAGDTKGLRERYVKLEKYDEMESKIQDLDTL
jgi:hypothetical protein